MKIVIVEDDPGIRKELKQLLENAFYEAEIIEEFKDTAEQICSMIPAPDLVLLDWNLPGESGFDICTKLKEHSDIPIIFLTSRTDSMDELTGILKGADDYITKPFNPPILLARIGVVLKRTTDKNAEKTLALMEVQQGLKSKKSYLIKFEGMTEQQAQEELDKINEEKMTNQEVFGFPTEEGQTINKEENKKKNEEKEE